MRNENDAYNNNIYTYNISISSIFIFIFHISWIKQRLSCPPRKPKPAGNNNVFFFGIPVLGLATPVIDHAIFFHSAGPPLSTPHVVQGILQILSTSKPEELACVAQSIHPPLSSMIEGIVAHAGMPAQML